MERRATAWRRGLDCDFPTAFEQHPLCQEAAAEITRLRAKAEALRKALREVIAEWEALPGGRHYEAFEISRWLSDKMGPSIDGARAAIDATKGTT